MKLASVLDIFPKHDIFINKIRKSNVEEPAVSWFTWRMLEDGTLWKKEDYENTDLLRFAICWGTRRHFMGRVTVGRGYICRELN